ncbi:MAG: polyprenyl synthetase family protein [Candidatus Gastranaerophilales bacterium]|nr:polyprenyl synthetase family protein [Candidatus Gastranaerophilales bacterium]
MDLEKYNSIKQSVKDDLYVLECSISDLFKNNTPLDKDLLNFLTAPAKRLRPLVGMLFLKCVFGKITPEQYDILLAVELIHNATLIHDDVIDEAQIRRKQETINTKFDNNLAVIAGDLLLSIAMEKVVETNSFDIIKIFSSALKSTCMGEIKQYFSKFQITSIDEYIEKSKDKTALLFEIAVLSGLYLNNSSQDLKQTGSDFAQNFGIAFQIRDDLINILYTETSPDINSGIYTAPAIFAYQENKNILNSENILSEIKSSQGIAKTKDLMENYFNKSISAIETLENNIYKKAIIELIQLLKTNL